MILPPAEPPNGNGNGHKVPDRPDLPAVLDRPKLDPRLLDPTGSHQKSLVFPGYDGFPFRGPVPDIKDTDPQQPQYSAQVFVHVLDLSKAEDLEYYGQIAQMVGNGFAQISFEDKQFIAEKKSWLVLIRWMLNYAYMPKQPTPGG